MFFFMISFVVIVGLVFLVLAGALSYFFSGALFSKSSGFECGFHPFMAAGTSFSMPFFVVSLMFLLFDVEIILMSFPPFFGAYSAAFWGVVLLVFFATCYEWWWGILSWLSSLIC